MNMNDLVSVPRKALRDFIANSACSYKGPEWSKNKSALLHGLASAPQPPALGGDAAGIDLQRIVTEALMGMIAAVTSTSPPANEPPPPFIQAGIDRAVSRISVHLAQTVAAKVDESAEFDKWRKKQIASLIRMGYPDAAKAFRDLGSVQWAGWQGRANLNTPQ